MKCHSAEFPARLIQVLDPKKEAESGEMTHVYTYNNYIKYAYIYIVSTVAFDIYVVSMYDSWEASPCKMESQNIKLLVHQFQTLGVQHPSHHIHMFAQFFPCQ